MALNVTIQLAESYGLDRILVFEGLDFPMVVRPMVHGEPLLTAQPFYYLGQLEAAGLVRFEDGEARLSESELEYLADNYLFEYSLSNPASRMTSRVSQGRFWRHDHGSFYQMYDERETESVAIDHSNDPSVKEISADEDMVSLAGWDLGRDSAQSSLEEHLNRLSDLLAAKIEVSIVPSEGRDGYMGKLRLIKPGPRLLTYIQAQELEGLSFRDIPESAQSVKLRSSSADGTKVSIPVERITASTQYNPVLLSYYFSALKDENPIKSFLGFYNVLEYYFGESQQLLGCSGSTERAQLDCVVSWLTDSASIQSFLSGLEPGTIQAMQSAMPTTSGIDLDPLEGGVASATCQTVAKWLYSIRCAVVHSKKTYRGAATPSIAPYSAESANVSNALTLVKWLSQLCIVKDNSIGSQNGSSAAV